MKILSINIIIFLVLFLNPISGISAEKPSKESSPVTIPTAEEKSLLDRGEISIPRYVGGAFLGSFVGFGTGHAIQGRFFKKGAYFLIGEGSGIGVALGGSILFCGIQGERGSSNCLWVQNLGAGIFVLAKAWEIFDLWVIPPIENADYRELIKKYPDKKRVVFQPFIFPTSSNGLVTGLAMSF